jgi:hypothetical protein
MFTKLARIPVIEFPRVVARRPTAAAQANDNRMVPPSGAAARRAAREGLVCRWGPTGLGGRLECRWSLEAADVAAYPNLPSVLRRR